MKFRFCGECDCPDWVLAEINDLSQFTSIKFKLLVQQVAHLLIDAQSHVEDTTPILTHVKLESDALLKASVAGIAFILKAAAKFDCDESVLANELAQLGLPQEHCVAFERVYADKRTALRQALIKRNCPSVNNVQSIEVATLHDCGLPTNDICCITFNTQSGDCRGVNVRRNEIAPLVANLKACLAIVDELI